MAQLIIQPDSPIRRYFSVNPAHLITKQLQVPVIRRIEIVKDAIETSPSSRRDLIRFSAQFRTPLRQNPPDWGKIAIRRVFSWITEADRSFHIDEL